MSRRARERQRLERMAADLTEPEDDRRHMDDEAGPAVCTECDGDGRDKWNDYLLPCPVCGGDTR